MILTIEKNVETIDIVLNDSELTEVGHMMQQQTWMFCKFTILNS